MKSILALILFIPGLVGSSLRAEARTHWAALAGAIDPERHARVTAKLAIQEHDAIWWRDASPLYFQTWSKRPLPDGMSQPRHTLEELKSADPLTGEPKHKNKQPSLRN